MADRIVVVGAGAFGGWTALELRRRGADVTLLDPWGAGNLRSSSGGETRVIRATYGADAIYVEWTVRAFERWREAERLWGQRLLHETGLLWLFSVDDAYARLSRPHLAAAGLALDELTLPDAARRFPQVDLAGIRAVHLEPAAGFLTARLACRAVLDAFVAAGGRVRAVAAQPGAFAQGRLCDVELADGSRLEADAYVFACGPWLAELFPDVVGPALRPTRQESFYFGTPALDRRFDLGALPVWIEFGERIFYGLPGNLERGMKVADDTRGVPIEPTSAERTITPERLAEARAVLSRRFPAMADAPLLGAEVCQYENSPDGHLILDRHPRAENLWLLGGGSGHGFKLGPALGELAAGWVLGRADAGRATAPPPQFGLARLTAEGPRITQFSTPA